VSRAPRTTPSVGQLLSPRRGISPECTYKQFYFSTDLPSPTCISRQIGFRVAGSGQKVTFCPTWHPYRFQTTFCIPTHKPSDWKSGWDPFSSLREIAGKRQAQRTSPRVGTKFLGHGLADFCAIFTIWYRIYPAEYGSVAFWKIPSFGQIGRHVGFSVGGSRQKVIFLPQPHLLQTSKVWPHGFYSSPSAVCVEVWLRSLQRSWRYSR